MDSIIQEQTLIVVLGGLVVIMLSTGPKVHRFKPDLAEDNGFLRAIKISSMTSFQGEVKLSAPCCKILWHVKDPCGVRQRYSVGSIQGHFSPNPCSLLGASAATRELWWMNKE
jgi:hypothetical protein